MIVDCDLHQGNGTAAIFAKKDYAFTFSIHQMDIYPADKPPSTVDVGLWSGDGDDKYLAALKENFPRLYRKFRPDLVFYLAGSDPLDGDQLGGLTLTKDGLVERDRIVIEGARRLGIPVAVVFAGGYSRDIQDSVAVHINTIKVAQKTARKFADLKTGTPFRTFVIPRNRRDRDPSAKAESSSTSTALPVIPAGRYGRTPWRRRPYCR